MVCCTRTFVMKIGSPAAYSRTCVSVCIYGEMITQVSTFITWPLFSKEQNQFWFNFSRTSSTAYSERKAVDERGTNFLLRIDFFKIKLAIGIDKLQAFISIKFLNFKFIGLLCGCSGTRIFIRIFWISCGLQ